VPASPTGQAERAYDLDDTQRNGCGEVHFIADSGEYWDDSSSRRMHRDPAHPDPQPVASTEHSRSSTMVCECDGYSDEEAFNVAVGYFLYNRASGSGRSPSPAVASCAAGGATRDDWMIRSAGLDLLHLA
jgi:hypothetical protein